MNIPSEVRTIVEKLESAGFKAYIVGGCVRDLLLALSNVEWAGRLPKDWDVATNAKPEEIQAFFPDSFYENQFGTVGVKTGAEDPTLAVIEITTFRRDIGYSDKRHPDRIEFAETIEEDLARRDFTINAMAMRLSNPSLINSNESRIIFEEHSRTFEDKFEEHSRTFEDNSRIVIIDPFGGQKDLRDKLIRAVGEPIARFKEDALRMMRAVRFAAELGLSIEPKTGQAIETNAGLLDYIAKERVADELRKIMMSANPKLGIELLREHRLLKYVLPELGEGWEVTQNKHHIYTVWEHNTRALQYAAEKNYGFIVRMAALLHDVGKPRAKRGEGPDSTFYGHEVVGAKMTAQMLDRLRFPKHELEKIALLVRAHMFNYDPEVVTDASVRRLVAKVGPENIRELVQVREADRIGSGVPKAVPYKLRHFMFRVEKVLTEPVSRKVMAINGDDLMGALGIAPGPRVGAILDLLFEDILDNPAYNNKEYLLNRAQELKAFADDELSAMRKTAREKYEGLLKSEEEAMKEKYRV